MQDILEKTPALSRRGFVTASLTAAGGLAIGVAMPQGAEAATARAPVFLAGADTPDPREINAWLVIEPDNSVLVRLAHSELGQGTATALVMLVAEELHCDWSKVRMEHASANRNFREKGVYKSQMTVGSRGVRTSVDFMQQAGASARVRLIKAAADQWGVAVDACACKDGHVSHAASGRSASYGALCGAAAKVSLTEEPKIKTPDQYRLVGQWTPRLDTAPKVNGAAQFGIDAQVPGMVFADVMSAPVWGEKLASVDETPALGMRGVITVVKLDDAVVVVADRYWRARAALDKLKPVWTTGPNDSVSTESLGQAYRDALDGPLVDARKEGDAASALAQPGAMVIEALYEAPYLAHAAMEPMNCTVHLQPDRLDVWVGSQAPPAALQLGAHESGIAPENVYIHNAFVGGGFGRRSNHDEIVHAIAVAKVVKRPVKLIWRREQDLRRDRFRPQAAARFKAALTPDGTPTAIQSQIAVGSLLRSLGMDPVKGGMEPMAVEVIATHAYKIPNDHVGVVLKNAHVPVSFWRSVGASQNTFFLESFIDEMAHAAGKDPIAFRRAMLDRKDYLGVLDVLADKGDWGKPLPKGSGRGVAIVDTYGTVTGQVVEVTVSPEGKLKVDRVTAVVDCYHAVNPNTIAQQIEGGVIFGLTAALYGEINIKNGAAVEQNFNTYPLLKMAETPRIDVHLHLTGGKDWGGIGEPSVAPIAPALCNAIFAATGKRVRKLPLKHFDLKQA